jgi:G3E family GTPase
VTTVVDAKHIGMRLDDSKEAAEQIAFADQIVLNKTDLVDEAELKAVESRIRRLNPLAPIHRAERSKVDLETVLSRGGFDLNRIVALEPEFLNPKHGEAGHVHDEHCDHDHEHEHEHEHGHGHNGHERDHVADAGIMSVSLKLEKPIDRRKIARWLTRLTKERGPDILRAKGIIDVKDNPRRLVFQAVHMILEGDLQREWRPNEKRYSRMVFIGRNLDPVELRAGFEACIAEDKASSE